MMEGTILDTEIAMHGNAGIIIIMTMMITVTVASRSNRSNYYTIPLFIVVVAATQKLKSLNHTYKVCRCFLAGRRSEYSDDYRRTKKTEKRETRANGSSKRTPSV